MWLLGNWNPQEWINFNSFVARVFRTHIVFPLRLPVEYFRLVLETKISPKHTKDLEIDLQTTVEWFARCSPRIYFEMTRDKTDVLEDLDLRIGPLCTGVGSRSRERWDFWKERLEQLSAGVSSQLAERVQAAKGKMELAEAGTSGMKPSTAKQEEIVRDEIRRWYSWAWRAAHDQLPRSYIPPCMRKPLPSGA